MRPQPIFIAIVNLVAFINMINTDVSDIYVLQQIKPFILAATLAVSIYGFILGFGVYRKKNKDI